MRTDGTKKAKGRIICLPEGTVTILQDEDPMIVLVKQSQLVERMEPEFWKPQFLILEAKLYEFGARKLEELLPSKENLIASDHIRNRLGETIGLPPQCDVEYYTVAPLMRTGYDLTRLQYCNRVAYERLKSTKVQYGDILIADSGEGGIGRLCFVSFEPSELSCTGHLFVLRPEGINGRFLAVFLHTKYAQSQIHRRKHGVGSPYIKSEDILELLVPIVESKLVEYIGEQYKWVEKMHTYAIKAKLKDKQKEAERYFQIAEGMLETLIVQLERLIERKQEDIIPLIPDNISNELYSVLEEEYRHIGELYQKIESSPEERWSRILGIPTQQEVLLAEVVRPNLFEQLHQIQNIIKERMERDGKAK